MALDTLTYLALAHLTFGRIPSAMKANENRNAVETPRALKQIPGTIDLLPEKKRQLEKALEIIKSTYDPLGYSTIDTPIIEPTELYMRKFGTALTSSLYNFTDHNHQRLSLRPEFTASIVRMIINNPQTRLPVRWQYAGPVFRARPTGEGGYTQFTQAGLELIGEDGPDADAEVVKVAMEALRKLGFKRQSIVLGDPGAVFDALEMFGLSERAKHFLITTMKDGKAESRGIIHEAKNLGFLTDEETIHAREKREEPDLPTLLKQTENSGTRKSTDIVNRFLRKREENMDESLFLKAIEFTKRISEKDSSKDIAKIIKSYGLKSAHFERILFLSNFIGNNSKVSVDFALVPDMAYYSGFVFQVRDESSGKVLASGGRYDELFKTLGGKTIPARGFAYSVEDLLGTAKVS